MTLVKNLDSIDFKEDFGCYKKKVYIILEKIHKGKKKGMLNTR